MSSKNLGIPFPRSEALIYSPLEWPESNIYPLEDIQLSALSHSARSFAAIMAERQTRYGFGAMSMQELGSLLALTCKVRSVGSCQMGFPLSKRPAPSAGAIHPIHVVIHLADSPVLHRYDPFAHALLELTCKVNTSDLRCAMNNVVNCGDGVLLMFVAEFGLTDAKYENAESLVWRDAGILQGYFSIAAESLSLRFVPLGITGEPWASSITGQRGLTGVGCAVVGTATKL